MLGLTADRNRSDADLIQWWANGGEETLDAYGIDDPSDLPAEHLAWMRALPLQVRGHTATRAPDVQANRVNLDTRACFGGPLTAAAFGSAQPGPLFFVNSDGLKFELRSEPTRMRSPKSQVSHSIHFSPYG
ncbi:hypothetical protein ABIB66_006158 [Bradyrhizobium sp. F1.13.3]